MMNDMLKGIDCRDISECTAYAVGNDRLVYEGKSAVNREAAKHNDKFGIQQMMDKIRKIYGWKVATNKWHPDTKSFDVTITENTKVREVKHVSYDEICKIMWWHSFDIVSDDTVKPVPISYDEREEIERPLVEASNKKMKKWLKEHPEELEKLEGKKSKPEDAIKHSDGNENCDEVE